ncbi:MULTISPECIES: cupin domain-containing protein [unclassified Microcoleus]|uniref:cupin domain-containing protein n=1 Tax=unclassified Microcoleus TaxID=2642155 RepID=UPI002FD5C0BE
MSQSLWLFGSRLTIVADYTTTAGQYDLIEEYSLPGSQTPLHRYTGYCQLLYVLEEEFTVWAGENKVVLSGGDNIMIPVGTPQMVAVFSDKPARGLVVNAPSGPARLIKAMGMRDETETLDMALLARIPPRWAMKPLVRLEPYPPLLQEHSTSIPRNRGKEFYDSL